MTEPSLDIHAVAAAKSATPQATFELPEACCSQIQFLTLRELTPAAELRAARRCENNAIVLQYEQIRESVVSVTYRDGRVQACSTTDNTTDQVLLDLGAKGRALLPMAFQQLNSGGMNVLKDFLETMTLVV